MDRTRRSNSRVPKRRVRHGATIDDMTPLLVQVNTRLDAALRPHSLSRDLGYSVWFPVRARPRPREKSQHDGGPRG